MFNDDEAVDHERLTSLIGSMADGVLAVDSDMKVVLYNGAALNILDSNGSMRGRRLDEVIHLIDRNGHDIDIIEKVRAATQPTSSRSYRIRYADGSVSNLYVSIAPVRLGYGSAGHKGFVLLLRDITREKSLEEERNEFISVVSHELRTPIAIAEGNISNAQFITAKQGSDPAVVAALQVAHEQIIFLSDMINDLATLSRAERGKLTVDITTINAHTLVNEIIAANSDSAAQKQLLLRADLNPHLETLHSSELYVREILANFVTNAIKYTQKGSVVLSARPERNGDGVLFSVSDTGIGLSKSDQERVFDKFFRSEDFRTRANSGTGLGLYVANKLARLLNAEISIESTLNKGSVFSVYVPDLKTR